MQEPTLVEEDWQKKREFLKVQTYFYSKIEESVEANSTILHFIGRSTAY